MKKITLLLVTLFVLVSNARSQSLDAGIKLYNEGDYTRALQVFKQYDSAEARLYTGKSYFSLNEYMKARQTLSSIDQNAEQFFVEALYTLALTDFQLQNFTFSIDNLYRLSKVYGRSQVTRESLLLYDKLLDYLTLKQRYEVFRSTSYDEIRYDLVRAAIGKVDYGAAKALVSAFRQSASETPENNNRISEFEAALSDSVSYFYSRSSLKYPDPPEGMAYNIGVALPRFDPESSQYEISQHLYFGIQLAVERYNAENNRKKVFISYFNTIDSTESLSYGANDLVWNKQAHAIIGPLFSETAMNFSKLAEEYETPVITPLANSDSLNMDLNYTFQLNPTFAIQGREMAQYAKQNLRYDTVAVIAEEGSLGEFSASAFRDEFNRLGGEIIRYDIPNLAAEGYDLRQHIPYLNPEDTTVLINTETLDAIYAPFTGAVASTLIGSLLTEVEASGYDLNILGSEEWAGSEQALNSSGDIGIYYTQSFRDTPAGEGKDQFDSEFRVRFKTDPNRFAYIGYDAASVVLNTLNKVGNPDYLKSGLKNLKNYKGFIMDVSFSGEHINQAVNILRLESGFTR